MVGGEGDSKEFGEGEKVAGTHCEERRTKGEKIIFRERKERID